MKISVIQFENIDFESKQERINKAVSYIRSCDSDLVLLPEMWNTGFFSYDNYKINAERLDGITVSALSDAARKKKIYIFGGSFIENDKGKLYNTSVLIAPDGELAGKYRKIHLFGNESEFITSGNEISVVDTEWGRMGMSICYDLRFPELYRMMSERGADILLSCYALQIERAEHWRILTPARALENQAFFISCGCTGMNCGNIFSGGSMIVSPFGETINSGGKGFEIISSKINTDIACEYRNTFPALEHRKIKTDF